MNLSEGDFFVGATQRGKLNVSLSNGQLSGLNRGFGGLRVRAAARLETQTFKRSEVTGSGIMQKVSGTLKETVLNVSIILLNSL